MKTKDIFLMVLLAAIWGFNFVPIRLGLNHVPPLTFTCLRFFFSFFPAIFFVKRPTIPLSNLALYGSLMFAGQFGFNFFGIHAGMAAGLASVVMQMQAFFTIGFAALLLRERPLPFQIIGAGVAACGIAVVGMHVGGDVTTIGLCFVLMGSLCWSSGNLLTKTFGKIDMLGVIVWGNLVAFMVIAPLAFWFEGTETFNQGFQSINITTWLSLAYITYASTFLGYSIWSHMLAHHPAASVVPFTLMVPIFAMTSATFFLGESFPIWKVEAASLVLLGLAFNQFGGKIVDMIGAKLARRPT